MIEFTLSRAVLCSCGVILLVSATSVVGGIYDDGQSEMDEDLVSEIAYMLDIFESSEVDSMILEGASLLPSGYRLHVCNGFVELYDENDNRHIAVTIYGSGFDLDSGDTVTVTR